VGTYGLVDEATLDASDLDDVLDLAHALVDNVDDLFDLVVGLGHGLVVGMRLGRELEHLLEQQRVLAETLQRQDQEALHVELAALLASKGLLQKGAKLLLLVLVGFDQVADVGLVAAVHGIQLEHITLQVSINE